jgi:protein-S-isoprenylcysteine O-methyltransferase Ste14
MSIADGIVIAAQCLWGICEFVIYKRMKSNDKNADQSSYKFLYDIAIGSLILGIFIGVFFKFDHWLGLYNASIWFPVTGACLIILGLIIRLSAINQLKRYFTINVAIRDDHHLITDGLYKYIRHPAYAGGILSFVGCGICYGNILSFLIIAIPYILLILNRIKVEEVVLVERFDSDYIEMQKKTKKLIPFIY